MKKVLLVEDQLALRQTLSALLREVGIEVVEANSQDAVEIADKVRPNLIVTDLRLSIDDPLALIDKLMWKAPVTVMSNAIPRSIENVLRSHGVEQVVYRDQGSLDDIAKRLSG